MPLIISNEDLDATLNEWKESYIRDGGLLEDIMDELEDIIKSKIDEWCDENRI